jgi:hypothetical protein
MNRASIRRFRFGHDLPKPKRSRCQRKTAQQRLADRKAAVRQATRDRHMAARLTAIAEAEAAA